jgi:hypothetical protein
VSLDPASGVFTWTPAATQHLGAYSFGITVTDNGSPPLSQTATLTVDLVDNSPATIAKAEISDKHGLSISLKFSQPVDASPAGDPNNYILLAPAKLKKKSKKVPPPKPIHLSVRYNPSTATVTLTAKGKVRLNPALQLTVIGTGSDGIAKADGLLLAGSGGQPGTNYVAAVTATRIKQIQAV